MMRLDGCSRWRSGQRVMVAPVMANRRMSLDDGVEALGLVDDCLLAFWDTSVRFRTLSRII